MCGIAGQWNLERGGDKERLNCLALAMARAIEHRGPDDLQSWADPAHGLGLGFCRLAILDLSEEGRQPMHSRSGRYVIVFNGEIYNFRELAKELCSRGHSFRGHSDTEVALAAFEEWGVEAALKRFVGMFAIALWDREETALVLARDRLGIKPLYYGWFGDTLLFGSELKALRAHPQFEESIDRGSLALFMRRGYVPSPYSIYKQVRHLPPGCWIKLSSSNMRFAAPQAFWSMEQVVTKGESFKGTEQEAVLRLEELLLKAVKLRMIADVPLGAFLSGGIDSSTVVALMQAQSSRPVKTFSIGFNEKKYDEASHAREVARHLGTEHTELYVSAEEAQRVIPKLPHMFDEPFADPSQVPTYLVSKLARSQVTVSLSGDGGDELFGGYARYWEAAATWKMLSRIPKKIRLGLAEKLNKVPVAAWNRGLGWLWSMLWPSIGTPGETMRRASEVLSIENGERVYLRMTSQWQHPTQLVLLGEEPPNLVSWPSGGSFQEWMMYVDTLGYLPSDILTKVDRCSMAVSLEARVPMLDHRVVEFAWSLPMELRARPGCGKWILRQVLGRYVPERMFNRSKMGFGIPLCEWLRGPLREWGEGLLDESRLRSEGYLQPEPVRKVWRQHQNKERDHGYALWNVLMFQAWLEQRRKRCSTL